MSGKPLTRLAWPALALGLLAILWVAASAHLRRACVLMDTPFLPICPAQPTSEQLREQLRDRIRANPGDASAWVKQLQLDAGSPSHATLDAATALAPQNPNVLRARVTRALERGETAQAIDLLVHLIRVHSDLMAAEVLARLIASGHGGPLLVATHLPSAAEWMPRVVSALVGRKMPLAPALPMMVSAVKGGDAPPTAVQAYMRSLKSAGMWWEAYALWAVQLGGRAPVLYNPGFDQPFRVDGFDWEVTRLPPSRAGASIRQRKVSGRGAVLAIEYTGRRLAAPLLRQYVFAPPGDYVLRGEYMTDRLRTQEGLAWTVRCADGAKLPAASSAGLVETAGQWRSFEFPFTVPPTCSAAASLQLETRSDAEARTGIRGVAMFDAFELVRVPP